MSQYSSNHVRSSRTYVLNCKI